MVVSLVHLGIVKKKFLVQKNSMRAAASSFNEHRSRLASNSVYLGSLGEHLSKFYRIGFEA